jgi:hypothetical protein
MLEPNFILPDPKVSKAETNKRLALLEWFTQYIRSSVSGLLVTGSMSYGQNHSVTAKSDLDMQLLVNMQTVENLLETDCFNAQELTHAIAGYRKGLYGQFSLVFEKDGVPMECHFWDEQAFIDAITFQAESTRRLRTSIDTPSTDYAYSFDREESKKDYFGEIVEGYAVGDFPSFRRAGGKLFLCRPITNILGIPLIQIGNDQLEAAIETCWTNATKELKAASEGASIDLDRLNIANTLPGRNKMSATALANVREKTTVVLAPLDNR